MTVCLRAGCPVLVDRGYCDTHRPKDPRPSAARRGYDRRHQQERRRWQPLVATGEVRCWRCGEPIGSTEKWDLGHDDNDRTVTRGPEHANRCNRAAAGRKAHQ